MNIGVDTALAKIAEHKAREAETAARAEDDHYATIRVPKCCIPEGAKLVEAYKTDLEYIVMGDPKEDDESHNCDAMGCGSLGPHVMARIRKDPQ